MPDRRHFHWVPVRSQESESPRAGASLHLCSPGVCVTFIMITFVFFVLFLIFFIFSYRLFSIVSCMHFIFFFTFFICFFLLRHTLFGYPHFLICSSLLILAFFLYVFFSVFCIFFLVSFSLSHFSFFTVLNCIHFLLIYLYCLHSHSCAIPLLVLQPLSTLTLYFPYCIIKFSLRHNLYNFFFSLLSLSLHNWFPTLYFFFLSRPRTLREIYIYSVWLPTYLLNLISTVAILGSALSY